MAGLSHFLEHCVLLGSEKFPEEGEYRKFFKTRGGKIKALTFWDRTSYRFNILPGPAILEGISRLADLIRAPTLGTSTLAREINGNKRDYWSKIANFLEKLNY